MSAYLATSPNGPLRYHAWACNGCLAAGGGLGEDRERVRDAASGHLRETGHRVTIIDGTSECLYPVATTAAGSEVPA